MSLLYVATGGAVSLFVGLDHPYFALLLCVGAAWPQVLQAMGSFRGLVNAVRQKYNSTNGET